MLNFILHTPSEKKTIGFCLRKCETEKFRQWWIPVVLAYDVRKFRQRGHKRVETQQNSFVLFRMCCESKKARVYATYEIVISLYRFLNMGYQSMP